MNQDFNNGSLSENLYRYLADRNCPVSIGEICSEVYFVSYSRREVARALQELAGTNDLFRSMKDGRAYYSVNRNEGGKNIVRKNIDNLQNALNGKKSIIEEEQNYDEKESLNQSAHSVSEIEILYKNGIIAKSDGYTMRIPDGFVEFKDEDRDFAFYLPNGEEKNPDNALVLILPVNDEIPMKQDFGYRLQKAYAVYYGGIFWAGPAKYYSLLFDNVRYITSEYGGYIATEVVGCRHYYFLVFCGECYKQIHLQFANLSGTEEDFDQKALDIIKGITVDKPLKPLEHLNDDSFLPERITESCIDKWCKTLAENRRQYHLLYSTQMGVEQLRIKYENEHGCFSRIQATIRVRSYLQELCGNIDGICSEIIEFWEKLKKKSDNDELLGKAYRAIKEFRDKNDKFAIDFFDDVIKESPKGCMEVQVQILNKDKGIIERIEAKEREEKRKKQEKERLEKEERRKQEQIKKLKEDPDIVWLEEVTRIKAKRKEVLENKLSSIEENRKNKIADAASERDNAFAQCEKDLEETSKAISDMEAELSSLGLFAVGIKAKLRKSIEAAKQRVQDLASQKNSILKTYERKIAFANNKAELDSKLARQDIEKEYPLPESPAEKKRKKQAEIKERKERDKIELNKITRKF